MAKLPPAWQAVKSSTTAAMLPKIMALRLLAALAGLAMVGQGAAIPPTLILYNGNVITVDARFRVAQAVAIAEDRFLAVGDAWPNYRLQQRLA